jgi:chitinase
MQHSISLYVRRFLQSSLLCWLLYGSLNPTQAQTCKEIIGYYPSWQWYDRNKLVQPSTIQYSKYSIINYAFFKTEADGHLSVTDPWGDKNLLLGPFNWATAPVGYDASYDFGNPAYHIAGQKFADYAHAGGCKFLISIGGWNDSNNFPGIAADPAKRTTFASQCTTICQLYDLDGIDIDWEYPGFADHSGTPADETNFTLLLQEVRNQLNVLEGITGKNYLLTIAVGAAPAHMANVEWSNVAAQVDMINLMSYDFFGTFDAISNHNGPLYAPAQGDTTYNIDAAYTSLTQTYSVSPSKINIGVAFYGRSFANCTALFGSHSGSDNVTFGVDAGTPLYYNILLAMPQFTRSWDNDAKVPYLLGNGSLHTFVSYDDEESMGIKAQYIVDKQAGGAIIWEITGDYLETSAGSGIISGTPLVDTMIAVFCSSGSTLSIPNQTSLPELKIYPNPAIQEVWVEVLAQDASNYTLKLQNMVGQIVYQTEVRSMPGMNTFLLPVSVLPSGSYVLMLSQGSITKFTPLLIVR